MARIREFNKDEVIDRAMMLFWAQGYEATSIRDLKETMGISSSSMYEVFGDKRGVFLAALARFCEIERGQVAAMAAEANTSRQFIARLFTSVEEVIQPEYETQGSLAFKTMVEFGTQDAQITELLLEHYFSIAEIISGVLAQGQSSGAVSSIVSTQQSLHLAHTILAALQGMATLKAVKPDYAYVEGITQIILRLLD